MIFHNDFTQNTALIMENQCVQQDDMKFGRYIYTRNLLASNHDSSVPHFITPLIIIRLFTFSFKFRRFCDSITSVYQRWSCCVSLSISTIFCEEALVQVNIFGKPVDLTGLNLFVPFGKSLCKVFFFFVKHVYTCFLTPT